MGENYKVYLKMQILELIKKNPNITYKEIAEQIPATSKTVGNYIRELIKDGMLDSNIRSKRHKKTLKKPVSNRKTEEIVEMILQEFKKPDNRLTQRQMAEKLGVSCSAIHYHVNKLKSIKMIKNNTQSAQKTMKGKDDDDELEL